MPQLGKILARRFASVYIAQLNGIYLWEYYLTNTNLVAKANKGRSHPSHAGYPQSTCKQISCV